jgi:hypothetical protein
MRIFHTLVWTLVALACAAPTCDTHRPIAESGSGAWAPVTSPTPSSAGSATHQDVVHAMESATGAKLDPAKPTKSTRPKTSHDNDGNYGRSHTSPPPKPELPDSGRKLGQACDFNRQCDSGRCEHEQCAENDEKRASGDPCDHDWQCISTRCHENAGCE